MRAIPAHRRRSFPSLASAILLLFCDAFTTSTPAEAKVEFRGPSRYFPVASPTAVAIADLDRDGHADLVVTNGAWYPAGSVSTMRGRGDGTFEPPSRIPLGTVPEAVVVEDLDGDDLLDVAVTHHGASGVLAGYVAVLRGNGDGTFRAATDYPAGYWVRSLRAADLDGDRDLDLVTEEVVLLGNGDGTFATAALYGARGFAFTAVGDLDLDGHPDLVTSNPHAEYSEGDEDWIPAYAIRLGNGDGTFREPIQGGQGFWCRDLEVADLNGDALLDLVISNHGDDRGAQSGALVHLGEGDGTFGTGRLFPTGLNPISVAVADLNGDGRLDVVTVNNGDDPDFDEHSLTILLGNGDGTFERQSDLSTGESPAFLAAGRLDGNATLDLVAANAIQSTVSVFLGNGDGTFGNPDKPLGTRPWALSAADFDRDGRVDLATTNFGPNTDLGGLSVIHGRGDGTFGDPLGSRSVGRSSLHAADLDGDLAPDLVVGTWTGFSVLLANGDGTFREFAETYLDPRVPGLPALADLDRDGRMDLAVPHEYGATVVSILLGHGDGSFGPISRLATGGHRPHSAAAGDLNGDGAPDLVIGDAGFDVSVLLGHGDGTFAPHVSYASGNFFANSGPVRLVDLDEDERLDAVTGNLVRLGNGDGTLQAATKFDVRSGEMGLVLEDFDGDHHIDIATLHGNEDRIVSVYPGRGDGTFGPRVDYGTGRWPSAMTSADFDGDGRTDLAVANYNSKSISILLNRSLPPVRVALDLTPSTLNLTSEGCWVSGVLTPALPQSASGIDVASIRLNGSVPVDPSGPVVIRRGGRELMVKFDHDALLRALPAGERVPVTVTGTAGGEAFAGSDTIRVLRGGRAPVDDEREGSAGTAPRVLSLRLSSPNPVSDGRLRLALTLRDDAPARLELLDVAGRVVSARTVEARGAGVQELELVLGACRPGIYFARLTQGGGEARARVALIP